VYINRKEKIMKKSELAKKYNTTMENIGRLYIEWIENEGWTEDGQDCETFGEYLDAVLTPTTSATEPFHKMDLNIGNM
jgi:hypothetical protein